MLPSRISSWYRQNKFRATRLENAICELTLPELHAVLKFFDGKCAYCGRTGTKWNMPFPLKESALFIQANVAVCCETCKELKGQKDLIWFHSEKLIETDRYIDLIRALTTFRGGQHLRAYMKRIIAL